MTGPLLVVASHGLDLLTFVMVASVYPIGGEWNPLARFAVAVAGLAGAAVLKAMGVGAMLFLTRGSRLRTGVAVAAGLLLAAANLASLAVVLS